MSFGKIDSRLSGENKAPSPLPQLIEKIDRKKEQHEQAKLFVADLNLQRKRFDVEISLFGKIATRFSGLFWWKKGLIGLGISAIAIPLGVAFRYFGLLLYPLSL